jgi:uncharacterized membrane protein
MNLPAWHPLIVHFPLALTVMATAAFVAARVLAAEQTAAGLSLVGTWNLIAGAIGSVFALGSGLAALIGQALTPAAHAAVASHAKWAMLTVFALLALAVWRGAGAAFDSRPSRPFLAALLLATAALIVTGYLGGENVYRYGVGVIAIAR